LLLPPPPATVRFVAVLPRLKLMVSPSPVNCVEVSVSTLDPEGPLTVTVQVPLVRNQA
jgi:hypothetical protein